MRLIPVLAYVYYDENAGTDGEIIKIEELSIEKTENLCTENGYYISEKICNIKTYMKSANLIFRLHNPTSEEIKNYPFPAGYVLHREKDTYYICFKNIYKNGRLDNSKYNPCYTAGRFYMDDGEGGKIIVNVHPSNISDKDYTEIIDDLIRIHSRLVADNLYNMSIGKRWKYAVDNLNRQFLQLKSAVREIEKNPDENLEKIFTYAKSHNVKKITPRTVTDIASGRNKVRTVVNKTTLVIDEHCMIKSYLENMQKLISRYMNMQKSDYMYSVRETEPPSNNYYQLVKNIKDKICRNCNIQINATANFQINVNDNVNPFVKKYNNCYEIKCNENSSSFNLMYPYVHKTKFLTVRTNNIACGCFFLYCLEKARDYGYMTVYGGVQIEVYEKNNNYNKASLNLDYVEYVSLGNTTITYSDFYNYICENSDKLMDYISEFDENVIFYKYTLKNYKNSQRMRETRDKDIDSMEKLSREIDFFIKKSEILKNSSGNKKIRSTNLFSMHPSYRRAYAVMKNNIEKFRVLEFNENNSIKIDQKTADIYEKWCLIKILSIFTSVYGFSFRNKKDNIKDIISRCLQENYSLSGSSFTLECQNPAVTVTIDYDKSVDLNDRYSYRPDFMFTISTNEQEHRFCMDAKYKNYNDMLYFDTTTGKKRNMTVSDDISEVAENKYIYGMKEKYDIDISGSYILHCNEDIPRNIKFKSGGNISIGAICLTPSNEDKNKDFCFLIQMIMEHYFKLYKEKCWLCGNTNIEVKSQLTQGNYNKYRILCKECGHFLIETHCYNHSAATHQYKIAKHICNNYYKLMPYSRWNVECTECGSSL